MIKSPDSSSQDSNSSTQESGQSRRNLIPLTLPRRFQSFPSGALERSESPADVIKRFGKAFLKPRTLVVGFIGLSAFYSFFIGRARYTSVSEFYIQQPTPLNSSANTIFGAPVAVPPILSSLADGQYLKVYLASPGIKQTLYPEPQLLEAIYAPESPDVFAGLPPKSSASQQVSFYQRQIDIQPQPMSGSIIIKTNGYQPDQALKLNQALLGQAQKFINEVNQSINADQQVFAEKELKIAKNDLEIAKQKLQAFQDKYGQLSPEVEQQTTSSFIAQLESNLVDLKVELATMKRRYIDPASPEVAYIVDQVQELERQIAEERQKAVGAGGRDLNKLTSESESLKADVDFASRALESARIAVDNSRRESQRKLKFIVMLSKPQLPSGEDSNWRWQFFLGSVGVVIMSWAVGGFVIAAIRKT